MTDLEVDTLLPGKELDALIHREVFGRKTLLKKGKKIGTQHSIADGDVDVYAQDYYIDPDDTTMYLHVTDGFTGMIPRYSTNISDAWRIIEHFKKANEYGSYTKEWQRFCGQFEWGVTTHLLWHLSPELICKAALKSVNHVQNIPNE